MYYITINRNNPIHRNQTTKYIWFNNGEPQQSDLPRDRDYYTSEAEGLNALIKAQQYGSRMSINSNGNVELYKVGQDVPVKQYAFGKIITTQCPITDWVKTIH